MRKIGVSPFQVVYGCVSRCPLNLTLPNRTRKHDKVIDFIEDLQCIHKPIHDHLVASTAKYKLMADRYSRHVKFVIRDKVWVVLTKDRFPLHEYNKLKALKIGPLEVLQEIIPNAYRLRLPDGLRTSYVLNVFIWFPLLMIHTSRIRGQIFPKPERMMVRTRIVFQVKHNSNIGVILFFIFGFGLNFIYLFIYSWIFFLFCLG